MGPKKKGNARSGASSSSNSSRPPAKGAAQVQLSAENQHRLRRLLQNTNSPFPRGDGASTVGLNPKKEPLSELQKQQAAKRLRNIYEKLAAEGFSTAHIELGLSALPPGEATLEDVLDWLCLNLPGDELPKKFSSGCMNLEMEELHLRASVQLLAAAKEDWIPVSTTCDSPEQDQGLEVVKSSSLVEKEMDKDMKEKQAEWIRQYMNQLNEEEGSESPSTSSDSDWEALVAEPQIRRDSKIRHHSPDPATRALSIAVEFQAAKVAAADAKQKGDKQKQIVSGQLIRKLKQEVAALGLSEDILLANSGTANPVVTHSGKEVASCDVEQKNAEDSISENPWLGMTTKVHGSPSPEKTVNEQVKNDKDLPETEDGIFSMFDEENTKQNELPASIVHLQKKEKAAAWALQNIAVEKKQLPQKKKEKKLSNQDNMQRQPKAVLQQQCQKNGWNIPKYERIPTNSDTYMYIVSIMRPTSGRGKNKHLGGITTYRIPDDLAGSKSIEESQDTVATWALFCLFPELPLYHIIPEPYRAMMLQWHMQGSETKMKDELEQNRRANFIDSLVMEKHEDHGGEHVSMLPRKFPDSEVNAEKSVIDGDDGKPILKIDTEEEKHHTSHRYSESSTLLLKYQGKTRRKSHMEMIQSRARLPIFLVKSELIHRIRNNEVIVISGETGSGKTTQVPQYILEDLISSNQGAFCNIVCTQPRRLAAISIAERVAVEQGDGAPGSKGSLVGYQVRLDSAWHQGTKLLFCTTGILLRRLAGDRDLSGVSHVIIDEVHERSVLGDFSLIILKDLIERRRTSGQLPLKIILMSATVDSSVFSSYFGNCPVVKVQGRTFPVETIYLEDIYEMLDYHLPLDSPAAVANSFKHLKKNKVSQNLVNSSRGRQNLVQYGWGDEGVLEEEACNPLFDESFYHSYSQKTRNNLRKVNEDAIDLDLLEELIMYIDKTGEKGAILAFLPGMGEILSLVDRLAASEHFGGVASDWILPLHSSISVKEQQKAFQTPPTGVRKIVVATNIAETSITIEDVVHVIDCGKHKEMQYDPRRGMSRMEEAWISQANAKQRCGRAGRVRHGFCFCLYTRHRFEKLLHPFQLPEMLRVPLVELCLQIKFLSLGKIETFLEQAIEHPKTEAVNSAISTLHEVGALDAKEELTALGFHLAKLPVDVHVGKMMLYGAILGCLSPILTIAACLSYKSPFSAPREQMSAAEKAKRGFVDAKKSTENSCSICRGQQSDQLAMAAAYNSWSTVVKKHGARAGYDYCKANFLNVPTLAMLRDMRSQFAVLLADIGFINLPEVDAFKVYDSDEWIDDPQRPFNVNAHLPSIIKATMCAGLYPNVAKMDDESVRLGHADALGRRAGLASSQRVHWMDGRQEVFIHPSSVNHNVSEFQHPFLVYHEKVKTSKVYIRDTTTVSPYTLLLFGGTISVQHQTGQVSVDGWLKMDAPAQTAVLFKELRAALDSVLQELIRNPKISFGSPCKEVVSYMVKLLVEEEKIQH